MARQSRIVVAGEAHHIIQRGNRRQRVFFEDADYREYIKLMAQSCQKHGVTVWAYCLMQNHIHLVVVPSTPESLAKGISEAHIRYTRHINFQKNWRGHLWQGRFSSYPMDNRYLMEAVRYVELNPIRARQVRIAWQYRWSSAKAHIAGENDALVDVLPMLQRVPEWKTYLLEGVRRDRLKMIRDHEISGLPLGDEHFVRQLERRYKRTLVRQKPGPKCDN